MCVQAGSVSLHQNLSLWITFVEMWPQISFVPPHSDGLPSVLSIQPRKGAERTRRALTHSKSDVLGEKGD